MQTVCITESGSTVRLLQDGWVHYSPSVESIRRGMHVMSGVQVDRVRAEVGKPLRLRLDCPIEGLQTFTTSPVESITATTGPRAVHVRRRRALSTITD